MRNKGFIRIMSVLCIALVCLGGFSVTAFAQTPAEETETDDSGVIYDPQPLTPEGNMSLVDDIEGEAAEDKQFIVVQSRNGNYFYIVIDHAAEGENKVHFLNQVDEADLLAIIESEETEAPPAVCNCTDKCGTGKINTACPVCSVAMNIFEAVTAVFSCADREFTAKGKTVLCGGWKELEARYRASLKKKPDSDDEENALVLDVPPFTEGQRFEKPAARVTEHETTPPKPHNEASLLSAMEHAGSEETDEDAERRGLGTPATRAAVIEKLIKGGFIERKGKQLLPTKDGINLVCVLPDSLTSPSLTAEWENTLTQIAKGKSDPAVFMCGIEDMARELVKTYPFLSDKDKARFQSEKTVIGKCPRCGCDVFEGKKNYYCSSKECSFAMWKNGRFFEERKTAFTPKIAAELLKSGKAKVKKLYSQKTGKTYDGTVLLADTGGKYVNYRVSVQRDKELE